MSNQKLTPAQRLGLFQTMTREHEQTLGSQPYIAGQSISFEVPRARLLSKVGLLIEGKFNAKHATEVAIVPNTYAPYNLIRHCRMEVNNGFAPFRLSGSDLYLYNKTLEDSKAMKRVTTAGARGLCLMETVASSGGTDNKVRFYVELPVVTNPRDLIGLINVQNPTTVINIALDFNNLTDMLATATGFTLEDKGITVTPVIETFTIPVMKEAIPDLSILKLVDNHEQAIVGAGQVTMKIPTGNTIRKMIIKLTDANGAGLKDDEIGEFLLRMNQADIPYKIKPAMLQAQNQKMYGDVLEDGVFVLDFASSQGIQNLAGSRDYIDTERLSEFWLETTTTKAGKISVIAETLSRLA